MGIKLIIDQATSQKVHHLLAARGGEGAMTVVEQDNKLVHQILLDGGYRCGSGRIPRFRAETTKQVETGSFASASPGGIDIQARSNVEGLKTPCMQHPKS